MNIKVNIRNREMQISKTGSLPDAVQIGRRRHFYRCFVDPEFFPAQPT